MTTNRSLQARPESPLEHAERSKSRSPSLWNTHKHLVLNTDSPRQLSQNELDLNAYRSTAYLLKQLNGDLSMNNSLSSHMSQTFLAYTTRKLSNNLTMIRRQLQVRNLLIISDESIYLLVLLDYILHTYSQVTIILESESQLGGHFTEFSDRLQRYSSIDDLDLSNIDLIIGLGNDGTLLNISYMFQASMPPVLPIAVPHTCGFLTNAQLDNVDFVLHSVFNREVMINLRMRLLCKVYKRGKAKWDSESGKLVREVHMIEKRHVINEVIIQRGPQASVTDLEIYEDNDNLITIAEADGLILSTPTGSTAYSMSAGGSLIAPGLNAINLVPVCPKSLDFRPLLLPDTTRVKIKVPVNANKGFVSVIFDGRSQIKLDRGDYLTVQAGPWGFPMVELLQDDNEFFTSIRRTFDWNDRDEQKSFMHLLSEKNKEKYQVDSGKSIS